MPTERPTMPLDTHTRMLRREAQGLPLQAFEVAEHKREGWIGPIGLIGAIVFCAIGWTVTAIVLSV